MQVQQQQQQQPPQQQVSSSNRCDAWLLGKSFYLARQVTDNPVTSTVFDRLLGMRRYAFMGLAGASGCARSGLCDVWWSLWGYGVPSTSSVCSTSPRYALGPVDRPALGPVDSSCSRDKASHKHGPPRPRELKVMESPTPFLSLGSSIVRPAPPAAPHHVVHVNANLSPAGNKPASLLLPCSQQASIPGLCTPRFVHEASCQWLHGITSCTRCPPPQKPAGHERVALLQPAGKHPACRPPET